MIGLAPLAALVALLAPAAAHAALKDCAPPPGAASYVVFLSEPEFTPQAFRDRDEMRVRFFDILHRHLSDRQDREMAGIARVNFTVARCANRVPAIDGSEFTDAVVRNLYDNRVVVEIWGRLDARPHPGSQALQPSAKINYLMVPIRGAGFPGTSGVEGVHFFDYPDSEVRAGEFIELVSNADLHAFVAGAIGARAFDLRDYGLAHEMLCQATAQLARIERRLGAADSTRTRSERIRALHQFLSRLAGTSVLEGRKRPGTRPALALHNPDNPCSAP